MATFDTSIYMPQIQAGARSGGVAGGIVRGLETAEKLKQQKEQLNLQKQQIEMRKQQMLMEAAMREQQMKQNAQAQSFKQAQEERLRGQFVLQAQQAQNRKVQNDEENMFREIEFLRKSGARGEARKRLSEFYGKSYQLDPAIMGPFTEEIAQLRDEEYLATLSPGQRYKQSADLVARVMENAERVPGESGKTKLWAKNFMARNPEPTELRQYDPMATLIYNKNAMDLTNDELRIARRHAFQEDKMRLMPYEMIKDITAKEDAILKVTDLLSDLTTPEGALKNSAFFGQVGSRWNDFKTAWVPNQDAKKVRMKIRSLIDTVYAGAGKQLSDKEIDLVRKAWIPDDKQPIENVVAALEVMKETFNRKLKVLNANIDAAGYLRDINTLTSDDFFDTTKGVAKPAGPLTPGATKALNYLRERMRQLGGR